MRTTVADSSGYGIADFANSYTAIPLLGKDPETLIRDILPKVIRYWLEPENALEVKSRAIVDEGCMIILVLQLKGFSCYLEPHFIGDFL